MYTLFSTERHNLEPFLACTHFRGMYDTNVRILFKVSISDVALHLMLPFLSASIPGLYLILSSLLQLHDPVLWNDIMYTFLYPSHVACHPPPTFEYKLAWCCLVLTCCRPCLVATNPSWLQWTWFKIHNVLPLFCSCASCVSVCSRLDFAF